MAAFCQLVSFVYSNIYQNTGQEITGSFVDVVTLNSIVTHRICNRLVQSGAAVKSCTLKSLTPFVQKEFIQIY
jgi:hypothetical protein